jgi:hypothetical protein
VRVDSHHGIKGQPIDRHLRIGVTGVCNLALWPAAPGEHGEQVDGGALDRLVTTPTRSPGACAPGSNIVPNMRFDGACGYNAPTPPASASTANGPLAYRQIDAGSYFDACAPAVRRFRHG